MSKFLKKVGLLSFSIGFALFSTSFAQELSGTISMYPQAYYTTTQRPEAALAIEEIVAEYNEMHADLTVELIDSIPSGTDYRVWLQTRLAGGQAPNIAWQQFADRNREGIDTWVPLNEFLERPNPYVAEGQPGSERWADLLIYKEYEAILNS